MEDALNPTLAKGKHLHRCFYTTGLTVIKQLVLAEFMVYNTSCGEEEMESFGSK